MSGYSNYDEGKFLKHTGASLQMDFNDGTLGLTRANGDISFFDPLQLHFHSPSEHTIDGKYFDVELHIVHKYKGTDS